MKIVRVLPVIGRSFEADLPIGAVAIGSGMCEQRDGEMVPLVWVEGKQDAPVVCRKFKCFNTAEEISDDLTHFASIMVSTKQMIHVYETVSPMMFLTNLN